MKRRANLLLIIIMIVMVALPATIYAQEPEPEVVTKEFIEAINKGDAGGAEDKTNENTTIKVPQVTTGEEGADPVTQVSFTGSEEVRAWLEAQVAAGANMDLGECTVEGERVTCDVKYTNDTLKAQGVAGVEGVVSATVAEGTIQTFDFAASKVLPTTGGSFQGTTLIVLALLGGLLLLGGVLLTRRFQSATLN